VRAVPEEATPLSRRGASWITHPFATWENPTDDVSNINWVRDSRAKIAPYTNGGTYLNFIVDECVERIAAAFGEHNSADSARLTASMTQPMSSLATRTSVRLCRLKHGADGRPTPPGSPFASSAALTVARLPIRRCSPSEQRPEQGPPESFTYLGCIR
jgi:hypothetical protein